MARTEAPALVPATGWVLEYHVGHVVVSRGPVVIHTLCGLTGYGPIVHEQPSRVCPSCSRVQRGIEKAQREAAAGHENQGRLF